MDIGTPEWQELIIDGAKAFDIVVDPSAADRFADHARELMRWNQKVNLSAITNPRDIALKHFLDSIAPAPWIPPSARLIDVGSGAGFPGIPLKIMLPSLTVTLIDGSRKKIAFLKHLIRILHLGNSDARHIRAEDHASVPGFAAGFDIIISRALSSLEAYVRLVWPMLAKNGTIMALKGQLDQEEIDAVQSTISKKQYFLHIETYELPFIEAQRTLVIIKNIH